MTDTIETYRHTDPGYRPLLFSGGWQVAVLNWEAGMDDVGLLENLERHVDTDEAFVLVRGRALLVCQEASAVALSELEPGVVCNVRRGMWHNLLASPDASLLIVENRDTHLHDVEIRALEAAEKIQIQTRIAQTWKGDGRRATGA